MNNLLDTKRLLETAYLTAITVIFAVTGLYIPALMVFTIFLSTVPLVVITVRNNEKIAILSALLSYILIIMLTGEIIIATTTAMSFSFLGLVLGYGMKRRWNFQKVLISSSGAYLFSLLLTILLVSSVEGVNQIDALIGEYLNALNSSIGEMNKMFGNVQIPSDRISLVRDVITYMVPGFLIVSSALFGFIALSLSKTILNRIGYDYRYMPAFSELKVSRGTTMVFLVSFVLFMFMKQTVVSAAIANIAFILAMVLMVCGIAVMDFFVKKAGIPGFVRVIIYIIVFGIATILAVVIPILHPVYVLIVLTLMDSTLDFRKLRHKGDNHG